MAAQRPLFHLLWCVAACFMLVFACRLAHTHTHTYTTACIQGTPSPSLLNLINLWRDGTDKPDWLCNTSHSSQREKKKSFFDATSVPVAIKCPKDITQGSFLSAGRIGFLFHAVHIMWIISVQKKKKYILIFQFRQEHRWIFIAAWTHQQKKTLSSSLFITLIACTAISSSRLGVGVGGAFRHAWANTEYIVLHYCSCLRQSRDTPKAMWLNVFSLCFVWPIQQQLFCSYFLTICLIWFAYTTDSPGLQWD